MFEDDEHLLLSSGWYGYSRTMVFKYDFNDCLFYKTFQEFIDPKFFAEGITRIGDQVFQLTWREKRVLVWNIKGMFKNKLEKVLAKTMPRFNRIEQGWGLASQKQEDGSYLLWASDSTDTFKTIDPVTWKHTKEV